MKLPELKQNLKFTLLSVACLSGLVSCYPVTSSKPAEKKAEVAKAKPKPSGLKSTTELAAAKKKKEDAAAARKSWLKRNKERLDNEEKKRLQAEKKEASDYRNKVAKKKTTSTYKPKPKTTSTYKPKPKPKTTTAPPKKVIPKSVVTKFAAPVPGKTGFVYNPYTHNQVDVRGIPSGTKVRDPHDSNPSHIFKVP